MKTEISYILCVVSVCWVRVCLDTFRKGQISIGAYTLNVGVHTTLHMLITFALFLSPITEGINYCIFTHTNDIYNIDTGLNIDK